MTSPASIPLAALAFDVRPGEVAANLECALEGLETAANQGAKILALPEKWSTSFLPEFSESVRDESDAALATIHQRARELEMVVVGSAPGGDGAKPFNELHFLGASGDIRPYCKRTLFSPTGEGRQCAAGTATPTTVSTPSGRICGLICYDLRFPELTRNCFWDDADLLVVCAQWPTPRASILELLARARAAENQMWVLVCNRAGAASMGDNRILDFPGTAMLIDPLGEVRARRDDGGLLVAEADLVLSAEVRKAVPCRRDATMAGLKP